jgi:hypothetical protein
VYRTGMAFLQCCNLGAMSVDAPLDTPVEAIPKVVAANIMKFSVDLAALSVQVPSSFQHFLEAVLAKDPRQRPTAAGMVAGAQLFLQGASEEAVREALHDPALMAAVRADVLGACTPEQRRMGELDVTEMCKAMMARLQPHDPASLELFRVVEKDFDLESGVFLATGTCLEVATALHASCRLRRPSCHDAFCGPDTSSPAPAGCIPDCTRLLGMHRM